MDIAREGDPRTHGDETWTKNRPTGQGDEQATGGSCCTIQTRMATFGPWPMPHTGGGLVQR